MEEKIQYMWPNGKIVDFKCEKFIIESDNEVFILGYDADNEQYSVLGLLESNDGEIYCYFVKQHNQPFYKDIIKKNKRIIRLKSNIEMGIWQEEIYKKNNTPPIEIQEIIRNHEPIKLVQKTSGGFMVPAEYGGEGLTFYNLINLSKPISKSRKTILENKLNRAIEGENYEEAAKLRDEIDKL